MNKFIWLALGLVLGLVVSVGGVALAKGEWSNWWDIGNAVKIRRIYDQENKLVCWVAATQYSSNAVGPGISCQPSLELDNPIYN